MSDINNTIRCPYCLEAKSIEECGFDAEDYLEQQSACRTSCYHCGKEFLVERTVEVNYSTYKTMLTVSGGRKETP